jgi:hypothetical protein
MCIFTSPQLLVSSMLGSPGNWWSVDSLTKLVSQPQTTVKSRFGAKMRVMHVMKTLKGLGVVTACKQDYNSQLMFCLSSPEGSISQADKTYRCAKWSPPKSPDQVEGDGLFLDVWRELMKSSDPLSCEQIYLMVHTGLKPENGSLPVPAARRRPIQLVLDTLVFAGVVRHLGKGTKSLYVLL